MSQVEGRTGAGALLREARAARALTLDSLAAQLKVPEPRLAALEAERWAELPDGPYARGLATSVCRALGVEPREVLQLMPGAAPVSLEKVAEGINRPLQLHPRQRLFAAWPMALLLGLLLMVAAGMFYGPSSLELPWSFIGQASDGDAAGEPVRMVEAPLVQAPVQTQLPPASEPAVGPKVPEPDGKASNVPVHAEAQGAQLSLIATEDTWVSIGDASGASLVARLLPAGERVQLTAPQPPLRVVLGNAPAAELRWRGQLQDLSAYKAARVARLTLQ